MTDEHRKLIEDNYNIFYEYFLKRNVIDEDLRQDCIERVCENIDKFDESRGKLSTFIFRVCDSAVAHSFRFNSRHKRNVVENPTYSLSATVFNDGESDDLTYEDTITYESNDIDDFINTKHYVDFIAHLKDVLTKREYETIYLYSKGLTLAQVSEELKTTKQCANFFLQRARKKAKKSYNIYMGEKIFNV